VGNVGQWEREGFHMNYLGCASNNVFSSPALDGTQCAGVLFPQSKIKLVAITDGTSNQLMVSETLLTPVSSGDDRRGRLWNCWQGETLFMTRAAPNSTIADVCYSCPTAPNPKAPCTAIGSGNGAFQLARSAHNSYGGVNACFADGTVRWIPNNIDITTWNRLGSREDNNHVDISGL
jgi:hypothetical protein